MASPRPYDDFLSQTDPFAGSKAPVWNAGSRSPSPFGAGGLQAAAGGSRGVPSFSGMGGSYQSPSNQAAVAENQQKAQDAWLYGNGGRGPLMSGNRSTANSSSHVPTSAITQMNVGGKTTYVNREDLDGQGGIKPSAFSKYGVGENDFLGQSGDPFSTENLLGVGMNDARETQRKADQQYGKRDALNKEYAGQTQKNRDAMAAGLKDTQATIKDAEDRFLKTMADYEDRTAQDMSAVAAGIRKSAKTAMQEAGQYTRADGTMKTPQEIEQDHTAVREQVESEVQQQLTPMASAFNNAITQMGQNFSQFAVANAQVRNAQQFQAIQYDLQQRGYLAEMVAANPETHVNLLDTLLAIGGVNAARQPMGGGQTISGEIPNSGARGTPGGGRRPADNGTPNPFDSTSYKNYAKQKATQPGNESHIDQNYYDTMRAKNGSR